MPDKYETLKVAAYGDYTLRVVRRSPAETLGFVFVTARGEKPALLHATRYSDSTDAAFSAAKAWLDEWTGGDYRAGQLR